jgi:spermidine synthase
MKSVSRAALICAIALGFAAVVTQIVLLREFFNICTGNELVVGIILGNWLLLTGLGSMLGRCVRRSPRMVLLIQLAFSCAGILAFVGIRAAKTWYLPGLALGLEQALVVSFILLLLPCVLSGMLLTLLSGLASGSDNQVGQVYAADSVGGIIGGLLFGFVLVHWFGPLQILAFVCAVPACAAIICTDCHVPYRRLTAAVFALAMMGGFIGSRNWT